MFHSKLVITNALMLILFLFMYESEGASNSFGLLSVGDGANINQPFAHQKVNLSVYYNSLCQSCAQFIIKDLKNVFDSNLISIVNLRLVPWANAHINNNNSSISCQNGPDECELNSLESCALNLWHKVDIQYELINCFEFLAIRGTINTWKECLDQLGLPMELFLNCFNMGNGTQLGKAYINQIAHLSPSPSFVPWVVVNNQPVGKDYANFTHYVCKAYGGVAVPEVAEE
ncbi:gamma-interferon-responsive lysosomal thiol protein isoform X2 [Vigna angularis]|uniref:gamma-interferon-responsive lysosomal thiol protein isoform X2 n=1 Tax=Phaseolus angularis TaxID=3914 RepID=UPI000809C0C1|nr:gamma-interferon-responsive lysosomal thiol protein isoform X2 [Vigna angularis]